MNPSSGDLSCLSLSSVNVNVSGELTVNGQAITGSGVAPSAGDVLKSSRTCMSPHSTITVPSNGSSIVVSSVAYVPESASSTIHVTFVGTRLMAGASGSTGQWITTIMTGGTHLGHSMHGYNNTQQIVDSSPTYASYTNSSTNSVAFSATIKQTQNGGASMLFFQSSGNKTAWLHIEEVAR